MSTFLSFESDPVDQPAAADPVDRLTWCALRIRVGQRLVSRVWDKSLQSERTNLYLPAFPIAQWLVENWWSLFNELCPADKVPTSVAGGAPLKWIRRHCLRSADSALLLPALYLFHNGQNLHAEWHADVPGSLPNMPGEFVVQQWSWLTSVGAELRLGPNPVDLSWDLPSRGLSPPAFGYELAAKVRTLAKLSPKSPLDSVEAVARYVTGRTFRFEGRNHAPGQGLRAIVGRSAEEIVSVGPAPPREDSQRFLIARSLYHALVTTGSSQRLVTGAFSWDQKASRAFAAELLAPRSALADRISPSGADSAAIELLSREFKASIIVIEHQLENAGISLSGE